MDRKDLLMEESIKRPMDKVKLTKDLDEGMALANMLDSRGWKILYEGYIKPNLNESRFIEASKEELEDVRVEIRTLRNLIKFITIRVENIDKLAQQIRT